MTPRHTPPATTPSACLPRPGLDAWAPPDDLDLLVVGGGATGLGVALQAALEGRRVALVEARDFAAGTSSRSTKLLHGGVRYLAQGRLGLVREALHERTTVLGIAPHLAQPLPFSVRTTGPLHRLWMWLGLNLYDLLAGSHRIARTACLPGGGLRYWDGQFEDARLALALARSAQRAGATLRNHTRVENLQPHDGAWQATLVDALGGSRATLRARAVVNATGVWVDALRQAALAGTAHVARPLVRPSQGIHLVVARERLPLQEAVLVPRTADGRVLFALPWLGATVIGTTDTPREDAPAEPRPLEGEVEFLLREAERSLGVQLAREDVRSVWAGLRPLVGDAAHPGGTAGLSREHAVLRDAPGLWTVTGGKWTTYRRMAADTLARMGASGDLPAPPAGPVDTRQHRLVGAPPPGAPAPALTQPPGLHLWGTEAGAVRALPGASNELAPGLTEAMVRFAARHEWAVTTEDLLARRWRLLFLDARQAAAVAPVAARLLQEETGLDPRLDEFLALCRLYQLGQAAQVGPG